MIIVHFILFKDHPKLHLTPHTSHITNHKSQITAFRCGPEHLSAYLVQAPQNQSPKAVKSHAFIPPQFQAAASLVPIDSPLQQAPVKRTWLPPQTPSPFPPLDPLIAIHVELKNSTFHFPFLIPFLPPLSSPTTQKIKNRHRCYPPNLQPLFSSLLDVSAFRSSASHVLYLQ